MQSSMIHKNLRVRRLGALAAGFTLVELLVVMGIMVLMMGISAVGYLHIRRGAELRGATASVKSTLMLARQYAITKREPIKLVFSADAMEVVVERNGKSFKTIQLPAGVEFVSPTPTQIPFKPSGSAGYGGTYEIKVKEKADIASEDSRQWKTVKVWSLTGVAKEVNEGIGP